MIMPVPDPNMRADLEWFGFIQSNGLMGSANALANVEAILDLQDDEGQALLVGCVAERTFVVWRGREPCIGDSRAFATAVLGCRFSPKGHAAQRGEPVDSVYLGWNKG